MASGWLERLLEGDGTALRLRLGRVLPARKDRPVSFCVPAIASAGDARDSYGRALGCGCCRQCDAIRGGRSQ